MQLARVMLDVPIREQWYLLTTAHYRRNILRISSTVEVVRINGEEAIVRDNTGTLIVPAKKIKLY
jgi:hypothetical protein